MSHNCRLKSKTGLRRSGITRTDNRQCSKSSGPRVVKPGKRFRRKSKTKKPWQNDEFKAAYMDENPECEFMKYFPKFGSRSCQIPTGIRGILSAPVSIVQPSRDPHHCLWGLSRRWDIRACLVAAGYYGHEFCHQYPDEGRILSLWVKHQKGELDWAALDQIYRGESYRDYISTKPPRFDWMIPYWTALIGGAE